ncbi:MAG: ribonuclease domain-containing protein [Ignavibacteriales bacterium]
MMKRFAKYIIIMLLASFSLFISGCSVPYEGMKEANDNKYERERKADVKNPFESGFTTSLKPSQKPLTDFQEVADYIKAHGRLPSNFITKSQARKLGWIPSKGNLYIVAPGKSIGGDIFTNREKTLPAKPGRIWREADIDYKYGTRNAKRILYSNDGLIYKTADHYKTFKRIY